MPLISSTSQTLVFVRWPQRNDSMSRSMTHAHEVLLLDLDVVSELKTQCDILKLGHELRDAFVDVVPVRGVRVFAHTSCAKRGTCEFAGVVRQYGQPKKVNLTYHVCSSSDAAKTPLRGLPSVLSDGCGSAAMLEAT